MNNNDSNNTTTNVRRYPGDLKSDDDIIAFAKYLVNELDIKLYCGTLYFKCGNSHSNNYNKLLRKINSYKELSSRKAKEVVNQLLLYSEEIDANTNLKVKTRDITIPFFNESLNEQTPCNFTPFYLDVPFDKEAYDENVDNFLNSITNGNIEVRQVLEEIIAHCILTKQFPHKIFFLVGNGANGKSTFVEMLSRFLGDLASHIDISSFDDATSIASLNGKLANIGDDIDGNYLEKSRNLKTIASGNTISVRPIYSQPVELKPTATLIFTANRLPIFKDKSNGLKRRIVVIPFNNAVTQPISGLIDLLSTDNAKSYLLNLAIKGRKRIKNNNNELSHSSIIERATNQYFIELDPMLAFIEEEGDLIGKPVCTTTTRYNRYLKRLGYKKHDFTPNKFSRDIKNYGYDTKTVTINGASVKAIVKDN